MAVIHGKAGVVTFTNGSFVEVLSWSVDATADVEETTAMDATDTYKSYLGGWNDWTATVETLWSATGLAALNTSATLSLLQVAAGITLTGTAIMTGYSVGSDAQGIITQTYSFQGSDTLSES